MTLSRRKILGGAALGAAAAGLPAPAIARERLRWRMVTSWPADTPGPGTSARRLADSITALSEGRLQIDLYGAGELVSAFEVFDAVGGGQTAHIGHTASLFWSGKSAMAPFFTTVPFGLTPASHNAWVEFGGGQALWDRLYEPFAIKPFMAGNSSMQMGGWFRREINSLEDVAGLKVRMVGLGAEVMRRLGMTAVSLPPGEIALALDRGTVEGAEFLGPWSDVALGLQRAASHYYWPGFLKPNGTAECLVNKTAFEALPEDLRGVVSEACRAENLRGLADAQWHNALALAYLREEGEVELRRFPDDLIAAAKREAAGVLEELAEAPLDREILESYRAAQRTTVSWDEVTHHAFLSAQLA